MLGRINEQYEASRYTYGTAPANRVCWLFKLTIDGLPSREALTIAAVQYDQFTGDYEFIVVHEAKLVAVSELLRSAPWMVKVSEPEYEYTIFERNQIQRELEELLKKFEQND